MMGGDDLGERLALGPTPFPSSMSISISHSISMSLRVGLRGVGWVLRGSEVIFSALAVGSTGAEAWSMRVSSLFVRRPIAVGAVSIVSNVSICKYEYLADRG
jgi:hypothetical protein